MKIKGYVLFFEKKSTRDAIIKVLNKLHLIELNGYRSIYTRPGNNHYYAVEIYGYKLIVKALVGLFGNRSLNELLCIISDNPDENYYADFVNKTYQKL